MKLFRIASAVLISLASVSPADACFSFHRHRARRQSAQRPAYRVPAAPSPAFQSVPATPPRAYATAQSSGSALDAVNAVRAQHGLRPLAYDPSLAATARANSSHGVVDHFHHWNGLEAVAGGTDLNGSIGLWLASPAHRAIILSPTATAAAVETVGSVTTFQAR